MESLLAEQPLIVSLMLGTLAVALIYVWLQTGKIVAVIVGIVCLVAIPLAFLIAARWETDRERIESLIYETADAIEQNDHAQVLELIGDFQTRQQAETELARLTFTRADVTRIRRIEMIEGSYPPAADVELVVRVEVSLARSGMQNVNVPRRLRLRFEQAGDRWLISDYEHMPIVGGPDPYTTYPTR